MKKITYEYNTIHTDEIKCIVEKLRFATVH